MCFALFWSFTDTAVLLIEIFNCDPACVACVINDICYRRWAGCEISFWKKPLQMPSKQMSCHDEFTWMQWWNSCFPLLHFVVAPYGKFLMSVVIYMTNHFQLILVPWYMPFEATLQARLGVAHPVDLVHKHWIISPSYLAALIIHRQPTLLCMCCIQILAEMTYIAFGERETVGFSSAEEDLNDSPVWPHHYDCVLTPLSQSDPDFDKLLSGDKESLSVAWILNAAPPDWPQSKFPTFP